MRTLQVALVSMDPHVLVQITFLGKRLAASEDWAHERLLLSVRSKMIKKIVPFFETSLTALEFAEKNLRPSFTLRLEIFHVFKCPKIRNV